MSEFEISNKFKNQMITGILSSPLLYIPHFHYSYIDKTLLEILPESEDVESFWGLTRKSIMEVTVDGDIIDFKTKIEYRKRPISLLLDDIIDYERVKLNDSNFEEDQLIFLIKNSAELLRDISIQRKLQTIASKYERNEYPRELTIILVSPQPVESLPFEMEKLISVIEIPNPTELEIRNFIEDVIPVSKQFENVSSELITDLTRTLQGLQHYEIEQIVRSTRIRTGNRLTEKTIQYALEEKKSIVKKSGIIEVVDSDISFDQVGGLQVLQQDLKQKAVLFKHLNEISKVKLPLPKGVLIIGMPGCGKSLIAKSIANEFGVSLLRLDINRLMGQYVGQSEANLRKALATAEAAHPCVLWIDEIEKAFAGANGSSNSSNDIVMRLMGHFLTWMQERKSAVYIVATANDVMRPEFMRKGRFDEVYFVDFPSLTERIDILNKKIDYYQQDTHQQEIFNLEDLTVGARKNIAEAMTCKFDKGSKADNEKSLSNGFSGAEIECVVNSVMEKKFIQYLQKEKKNKGSIKVTKQDFLDEINLIKDSVMSNQKGKKDEPTSVERIRSLQEVYKFRLASKL